MPFIPDDILDAVLKDEPDDLQVLLCYAMLAQSDGVEPEVSRIAAAAHVSLDNTQETLDRLSRKGWLMRVWDYGEIIGAKTSLS